ncbi:MAG TPA: hypothetical protein VEA16_14925 [Vicinamibacterales bacterium]|nr:hypothetical protein [Vicinamibacterales bacterium]
MLTTDVAGAAGVAGAVVVGVDVGVVLAVAVATDGDVGLADDAAALLHAITPAAIKAMAREA